MTALPLCIYNYSFVEESEGTPLSPNSIFVQLSTNDLNSLKAYWYKCIDNCRVKSNHGCVWKSCSTNRHQQCNHAININRKLSYTQAVELHTMDKYLTVSLFFSEPVNYFTLQSEQGGTPAVAYNLMDSQVSPVHSSIIRKPVIEADLGQTTSWNIN